MRAGYLKLMCGILVVIMSVTGYSSFFIDQSEGNITTTELWDGISTKGSHDMAFSVGGGSDNSSFIQLPIDANVVDATMRITGRQLNDSYPWHVALDVGDNGVIEWKFDEIGGGAMGFQKSFWDGINNTPFEMGSVTLNTTQGIRLPTNADVLSATVDLWAEEQDYLDEMIELNLPGGGLFGPWDDVHDFDPSLIVFNNRLFDVYRTHSEEISNATDGDIVTNWTTDGITWAPANVEITKDPDGEWPWINPREKWWGMDMRPSMAVHNGRLYVAWESNSTKVGPYPLPGNPPEDDDDEGVTSGWDKDIVITSSATGTTWTYTTGSYLEITNPDVEDGNSSGKTGYNKKNPYPHDWYPQLASFNNRLYCVWVTNNTESDPDKYGGSDLMITWSDDPTTQNGWNNITRVFNLSGDDAWNGSDFNPKLVVFQNQLFVFWQTNDTSRGNGSDYDILYRYTADGDTWSGINQFSPKGKNDWTEAYLKGIYPLEFWDMTPQPIVFNNKLGIAWETENYRYTYNRTWDQPVDDQQDADIVIAWSSDGKSWDLERGVNTFEITQPENDWGDHFPHLTTLDPDGAGTQPERVYATWNSNDQGTSIWDYDIMYTYSEDGETWKPQRFASPHPDHGGGDYWAHVAAFKGWLYVTWWSFDDKDGDRSGTYADGDDADVLVRRIVPSYLPVPNISVDVYPNDGVDEFAGTLDTTKQTLDIKKALNDAINAPLVDHEDEYGNKYRDIQIEMSNKAPGNVPAVPCRLWLANLSIEYQVKGGGDYYLDVPDFSYALNEYIRIHKDDADAADGILDVPIKIIAESECQITISEISVEYNRKPTIKVTNPGDTLAFAKETFLINWEAQDLDDTNSVITLFYDEDNVVGGETEIDTSSSPLTVSGAPFYWWDTSNLPIGSEYYIKAVINDFTDSAYSYSKSKVKVTRDNVPPSITITSPSHLENTQTEFSWWVTWQDSDEDSDAWVSLYYDTNTDPNDGKTLIVDGIRENDPFDKHQWIISDEIGPGNYYIYGFIEDEENNSYDYSSGSVEVIAPTLHKPVHLGIENNLDPSKETLKSHDLRPKLTWINSPLNPIPDEINQIGKYKYILNIGTSDTTKDDIVKNYELDKTFYKIGDNLTFGRTYYFEIKATDGKGHFSAANNTMFEIINNAPEAPNIRINPSSPSTLSTIDVQILNASIDPDGDIVEYVYEWTVSGSGQIRSSTTTVSPAETKKGETWQVKVTPWDKIGDERQVAGTSASAAVHIENSAPRPKITAPKNNSVFQEGQEITFLVEGRDDTQRIDPDEDKTDDQLTYTWRSQLDGVIGTEKEFTKSNLKIGVHWITLEVSDDETSTTLTMKVEIEEGPKDDKGDDDKGAISGVALAAIILVVVIVVVIVLMLFLMRKRTKEEPMYPELDQAVPEVPTGPSADQLYGADMAGEPGAAPELPPTGPPLETPPAELPPGGEALPPAEGEDALAEGEETADSGPLEEPEAEEQPEAEEPPKEGE